MNWIKRDKVWKKANSFYKSDVSLPSPSSMLKLPILFFFLSKGGPLALQHGSFAPHEWLAAKGVFIEFNFYTCSTMFFLKTSYGRPQKCSYNPGQNLLRQIAKMPIFSCHPGKNWNRRQMNARFPPSPYPKLFRIAWQLYTLVFRPRQLWIGGGEGVYFLCLGETGVGRKS